MVQTKTINDFTSFLDNNGNFYLGSGSALGRISRGTMQVKHY